MNIFKKKTNSTSPPITENRNMNNNALEAKAAKANTKLVDNVSNTVNAQELNSYNTADVVFSCVGYAADVASQVVFNIYEEKGGKKVPTQNKQLQAWLAQPNPFLSMSELIHVYIQSYLLGGNAYLTFEKVGKNIESWVLDPTKMVVVPDPKKYIAGYTFDDTIAYKPEEVIAFKNLTATNMYYGESYIKPLVDMLSIEGYGVDDLKSYYNNSLIAQGIFTSDMGLTTSQVESLRRQFEQLYGQGGSARYGHLIAPNNLTWKPIKSNPKDAMLLESLKLSEDRIYKVFRLSRALLGEQISGNNANIKDMKKNYVNNFIRPLLFRMLKHWETFFKRVFKNNTITIETDYSNIPEISQVFDERVDNVRIGISTGVISIDEGRDLLNLPKVNGKYTDSYFSPAYLLGQNPVDLSTGKQIVMGQQNE
jgi:HK97 family phage portal protein